MFHIRSILNGMLLMSVVFLSAQNESALQKLGYAEDARLLIIHADDLGVTHSENMASIKALESSPVNSASIMVPCPWFPEIAAYARDHSGVDFGLHLTLNAEWKYYKWGPVSSKDSVASLVNSDGYFYSLVDSLNMFAKADQVETELRNQITKAYKAGIDVTHLDAHMGAAVSTPQNVLAYLKVGKEFQLPVLLDKRIHEIPSEEIKSMIDERTLLMDGIYSAGPEDYKGGMAAYYEKVFRELPVGISSLLIHLAYDDEEMQAVTIDHPNWGAAWRQADMDFFTSDTCKQILEEEGITLVSWREIRDKITRAK
ncbi:MAG: polysaccharide deacetylase family protein [Bacteroidia bacterium]|nr:polysaccharide deacetylase family protein [Bacteroidia bacterium]